MPAHAYAAQVGQLDVFFGDLDALSIIASSFTGLTELRVVSQVALAAPVH